MPPGSAGNVCEGKYLIQPLCTSVCHVLQRPLLFSASALEERPGGSVHAIACQKTSSRIRGPNTLPVAASTTAHADRSPVCSWRLGRFKSITISAASFGCQAPSGICWKPHGSPDTLTMHVVSGQATSQSFFKAILAQAGTSACRPTGSTMRPTRQADCAPIS